jgi:hypothetical protein
MAGNVNALGGQKAAIGQGRKAIEAARTDYVTLAEATTTLAAWRAVWSLASEAGDLDDALKARLAPIGKKLADAVAAGACACGGTDGQDDHDEGCPNAPAPVGDGGVVDAEVVEDSEELDRLWGLILENAEGMDYKQLEREFAARTNGLHPQSANAEQMKAFLAHLQNTVAAGVAR